MPAVVFSPSSIAARDVFYDREARGLLAVAFQPIYRKYRWQQDRATWVVAGAELLLRWRDDVHSAWQSPRALLAHLSPIDRVALDWWTLEQAVFYRRAFGIPIHVNVTSESIRGGSDAAWIQAVSRLPRFVRQWIGVEIHESWHRRASLRHLDRFLTTCNALGVATWLDDIEQWPVIPTSLHAVTGLKFYSNGYSAAQRHQQYTIIQQFLRQRSLLVVIEGDDALNDPIPDGWMRQCFQLSPPILTFPDMALSSSRDRGRILTVHA